MAKARKTNPDGYVHTRDAREYQRLRDQARMWQGDTAGVLAAVGLGPGMSCLDVGSGPGAVMRLVADRVGPQGRVTGIEIDAALGAEPCEICVPKAARSSGRSPPTSSPSRRLPARLSI
jgi:predicted methyltransferase